MNKPNIFPLGESAATVDFGNQISFALNDRVLALDRYFAANAFAGLIETVPAYSSLTVFYDVYQIRRRFPEFSTAFDFVRQQIENALLETNENRKGKSELVKIPVCFESEFALDLEFVAAEKNLSPSEVIEIFLAKTYRVFLLGFLPGFSYMGETDERIAVGRKENPRPKVPAGSVGIAGKQTGIYSLESPGGWQIIGRTPFQMFNPNNEPPTVLQAGNMVRFYPIEKPEFAQAAEEKQSEIRNPKSAIE